MNKLYPVLFLWFAILSNNNLSAQCPPAGDITFDSQFSIDYFIINYPNCTEIDGNVTIEGADIWNFYGLQNITLITGDLIIQNNNVLQILSWIDNLNTIEGNLTIQNNPELLSFEGLSGLQDVEEYIRVINNNKLVNFSGTNPDHKGFISLTSIGGYMLIYDNFALQDLSGLDYLTSIGGFLNIKNNNTLQNLSGLDNLTSIGDLIIEDNNTLQNLSGLDNLTTIGGYCKILTNNTLTSLSGLNALNSIGGVLNISFNQALTSLSGLVNLSSIGDEFTINNIDQLTDLSGLENLSSIGGSVWIFSNDGLTNLSGLDNLSTIGGYLSIEYNYSLTSLSGLDNLNSINGDLNFDFNSALTNFSGLDNLNSINGRLYIGNNNALENLSGLEGLNSINGYIYIETNNNLSSLSGIDNIDPTSINSQTTGINDIEIRHNPNLSECEVLSVCEVLNNGGSIVVVGNKTGCATVDEVITACTLPDCTDLTDPVDGETGVLITTDLTWAASDNTDGYYLKVGTSPGSGDIEDNDVGNVTTWYPPNDFDCETNIYVTINPYNNAPYENNCSEESFETEYVISEAGDDVEICNGSSTQLQASGGTIYSWSPVNGLDDPDIADPEASPTVTTTYTVTISNNDGCTDIDEVTVTVNPLPIPNATATGETGNNFNDGTATSNPTSGTPGYSYTWSNGQNAQTITGLNPGNYTVTVTDSKSCSDNQTVTVEEFICPELTIIATILNVQCNGDCNGSITVESITNGVSPYTYLWSDGQTTQTATYLCPGDYTVTITDTKNCSVVSGIYTITEPDLLELSETHANVSCFEGDNGSIDLSITGGTNPYSYQWSNGEESQYIENLEKGDYTVTVTDYNGCTETITITINEPTKLFANASATDETAYQAEDGTATANPTGGTPPYTYLWDNGATTDNISGLSPGTYTITVTDYNDCKATQSCIINKYGCSEFDISSNISNAICYEECDGSIQITDVKNAVKPVTYIWNTGQDTSYISNLCQGVYYVTITDKNNCSTVDTFHVTQPEELKIQNQNKHNITDSNSAGSIEIEITGGTKPYTYRWTGMDGFTSIEQNIDNLVKGCYKVVITDANGCMVESEDICIEDQRTGTYDLEKELDINFYPNPAIDMIYIRYNKDNIKSNDIHLNIYTISGIKVKSDIRLVNMINIADLDEGIYLISINTTKGIVFKKIAVIR